MRAKQAILDDIALSKEEIERLFLESAANLFGKKPPADLNLLAITSNVPGKPRDHKAQVLVNYFHAQMRRLTALQQLVEKVPDITADIESSKLQKSVTQATGEILIGLQSTHQDLIEKYQKKLKEFNDGINSLTTSITTLQQNVKTLDPNTNAFTTQVVPITQEIKQTENSLATLKGKFIETSADINRSIGQYNSPRGVQRAAITGFLKQHPQFQQELIAIGTTLLQIPKELQKNKEDLQKSAMKQESFLFDTKKDLDERYIFYRKFADQYDDAETVAKSVKTLKENMATLGKNIDKLAGTTENIEKNFNEKFDINLQKELTEIEEEISSAQITIEEAIEHNYRELTRKSLALQNIDLSTITAIKNPEKRKLAINDEIIRTENLITSFKDFQKKEIVNLSAVNIEKFTTGINEQIKNLANVKKKYDLLLQDFAASITETEEKFQGRAGQLQKEITTLVDKINRVNELIYFSREQLPFIGPGKKGSALKPTMSLAEIDPLVIDIKKQAADINSRFEIINKKSRELVNFAIPSMPKAIDLLNDKLNGLNENYQETINNFGNELKTKYEKTLDNIASKDEQKITTITTYNYEFSVQLDKFLKTLQPKEEVNIVSQGDRSRYIKQVAEYLESRRGFVTIFFRNDALTSQKNIIGEIAMKYFHKLVSPKQFTSLLDLLMLWNKNLEAIAGKKYKMDMKSGLEKVLQDIKSDLAANYKPRPQPSVGT